MGGGAGDWGDMMVPLPRPEAWVRGVRLGWGHGASDQREMGVPCPGMIPGPEASGLGGGQSQ